MIILALAAMTWTNAGWADNPKPVAVRASWASDPFARQALPVSLRADPKPEPVKPPAPVPPKPPAARPRLWQLADRSGQRWQHADPNWLKQWVAQRNAAMVPQYTAPVLQFGSPCANGSCPR